MKRKKATVSHNFLQSSTSILNFCATLEKVVLSIISQKERGDFSALKTSLCYYSCYFDPPQQSVFDLKKLTIKTNSTIIFILIHQKAEVC